jgi:hypothetical protein
VTTTLRRAFDDALSGEPPMATDPARAARVGRQIRRRRQGRQGAVLVGVVALAVGVGVPLLADHPRSTGDELRVAPFTAVGAAPPATQPQAGAADGLSAEQQRIADAIRSASPEWWVFEIAADRWTTHPGTSGEHIEATADDGAGPGRLMVGVSPSPGSQQLHPCRDSEFASSATCVERPMPDGGVLSLRGVVDWKGIQTVYVVLTHPDGSGVGIESGNFTLTWPLPTVVPGPEAKRNLTSLSRPHPTYSVDQLAEVVIAVDRVVHG